MSDETKPKRRPALSALSPQQKEQLRAELDAWNPETDPLVDEIASMSEAELTLWLARNGHSPEDTRRSLARAIALVVRAKEKP